MFNGKRITSYSLSAEAKEQVEYVSNEIASYYHYPCSYCEKPFFIVDPITHQAGGAFQRELIKHKDNGEVLGIRRTMAVCLSCINDMLQRQQLRRS